MTFMKNTSIKVAGLPIAEVQLDSSVDIVGVLL